ncbi:MAG: hypothetical protein JXQ73_19815 [Phycisphaerae bacterium]|nr:hypothetical protein [Phycisphaerae bacterium]
MRISRVKQATWALGAAGLVVAVGCGLTTLCPETPIAPLKKTQLTDAWRLSMLSEDAISGSAKTKLGGRALMIAGKTFVSFDAIGNLKYIGTLGADESVGLWEINLQAGLSAIGLKLGLPTTGPVDISNIGSSVTEMADGTVTARMTWRRVESDGTVDVKAVIALEQMRHGPADDQVTAVMSITEEPAGDPAPQRTHLIGEVLLERIKPTIREFVGDIYPVGEIVAAGGALPPYNDDVTFGVGQFFSLDAGQTSGPSKSDLTYFWHVVRERTDPDTGEVVERERISVLRGETSGFIASNPGRYYVTLYVTDDVLWRSTQTMGQASALTRFVRVE